MFTLNRCGIRQVAFNRSESAEYYAKIAQDGLMIGKPPGKYELSREQAR